MNRVIYSLYIDVPEKEHFGNSSFKGDTAARGLKTRNAFKEHYQRLIDSKKKYADRIGASFHMYEYDKNYKTFSDNLLKDFPFLTGYEIVNFYKIHLLYVLAKNYDEILYLDFDAIPVTTDNFFEAWDLTKGICVYNNNAMINKMNMTIDKIAHGIRSPTSKYYNAQAMLIANGHNPKNDVINTGIIGANKENILKLDFWGKFFDTMNLMTKLRTEGLDDLYPENIYKIFRYDNETIFSYKVEVNKIDIQWFDTKWHYFFDSQHFIPKETKIVHAICKEFDTVWRYYEKYNF